MVIYRKLLFPVLRISSLEEQVEHLLAQLSHFPFLVDYVHEMPVCHVNELALVRLRRGQVAALVMSHRNGLISFVRTTEQRSGENIFWASGRSFLVLLYYIFYIMQLPRHCPEYMKRQHKLKQNKKVKLHLIRFIYNNF